MPLADILMIADGHDNTAELTPLAELSGTLFARYTAKSALHTWKPWQGRALKADRSGYKTWGKPSDTWQFAVMTQAELDYVRDTFGAAVTIRTYNKHTNTWGNYNATLLLPDIGDTDDATWDAGYWRDVKLSFIDLVEIVE